LLSSELYSIPLGDNKYLIYAPLRYSAFIANSALVNAIADLKDGLRPSHQDAETILDFLRQMRIFEAGEEQLPLYNETGVPEPTSVTLFLTTACNLRCTYCYASAGERPVRNMPFATAKQGIDFVIHNALKKQVSSVQLGYHGGGEPTALWEVFTKSHEYARVATASAGLELHSSSATNAVLTDDQISWIVHNLTTLTISMDGFPAAHDKHRPMASGSGSSGRVEYTMKQLDRANYHYDIRMTVTADNIAHLSKSVEHIFRNFNPAAVQVEPCYQLGRWKSAPSAETDAFLNAFREARGRAVEQGRDLVFSGARVGTLSNHFCGVSRDSFSIAPNGSVSACFEVFSDDLPWAEHFFYGRPSDTGIGYEFDDLVVKRLRAQSVENRDHCRDCFAKWSCGGDCYHKALSVTGAAEFCGTERCHIIRELTKDQLLEKIWSGGGLYWLGQGYND